MTDTVKGLGDNGEECPDQGRSLCKGTRVTLRSSMLQVGATGIEWDYGVVVGEVVKGANFRIIFMQRNRWESRAGEQEAKETTCGIRSTETAPEVGPTDHSVLMLTSEKDLKAAKDSTPIFKIRKSKFALGGLSKPLCNLFLLSADSFSYRLLSIWSRARALEVTCQGSHPTSGCVALGKRLCISILLNKDNNKT